MISKLCLTWFVTFLSLHRFEADFFKADWNWIDRKVYKEALKYYKKKDRTPKKRFLLSRIYTKIKTTSLNVVPFTDGVKSLSVVTDLKKAYDQKGNNWLLISRKNITLSIVDEAWKNTYVKWMSWNNPFNLPFWTKDPLLIYKFEAFNLFNSMLNGVNKVISFLFKEICRSKALRYRRRR
jgi:preprotein translocase subunit SecA